MKLHRTLEIDGDVATIRVFHRSGECTAVIVDRDSLSLFEWETVGVVKSSTGWYPAAWYRKPNGERRCDRVHRIIMAEDVAEAKARGLKPIVDHVSLDRFDARRSNLRIGTNSLNIHHSKLRRNSRSGKTGVLEKRGKWWAILEVEGKRVLCRKFNTFEEAVQARLQAEQQYLGTWSPTR